MEYSEVIKAVLCLTIATNSLDAESSTKGLEG